MFHISKENTGRLLVLGLAFALPFTLLGLQGKARIAPVLLDCVECPTATPTATATATPIPPTAVPENAPRNSTGGALVGYWSSTGEQQLWSNTGLKLLGIAVDDMRSLAATSVGTTVSFTAEDGKTITLTNLGHGNFGGTYNGGSFTLGRPDLASIGECEIIIIQIARARVSALPAGPEKTIAQTMLAALNASCS